MYGLIIIIYLCVISGTANSMQLSPPPIATPLATVSPTPPSPLEKESGKFTQRKKGRILK